MINMDGKRNLNEPRSCTLESELSVQCRRWSKSSQRSLPCPPAHQFIRTSAGWLRTTISSLSARTSHVLKQSTSRDNHTPCKCFDGFCMAPNVSAATRIAPKHDGRGPNGRTVRAHRSLATAMAAAHTVTSGTTEGRQACRWMRKAPPLCLRCRRGSQAAGTCGPRGPAELCTHYIILKYSSIISQKRDSTEGCSLRHKRCQGGTRLEFPCTSGVLITYLTTCSSTDAQYGLHGMPRASTLLAAACQIVALCTPPSRCGPFKPSTLPRISASLPTICPWPNWYVAYRPA